MRSHVAHNFKKAGSLILVTGEFSHLALFVQEGDEGESRHV